MKINEYVTVTVTSSIPLTNPVYFGRLDWGEGFVEPANLASTNTFRNSYSCPGWYIIILNVFDEDAIQMVCMFNGYTIVNLSRLYLNNKNINKINNNNNNKDHDDDDDDK